MKKNVYICKKIYIMINQELIHPKSIVVVGGSNNTSKPGGNCVRNLINGRFAGELYVVNPKETEVQGLKSYHHVSEVPPTELAVIAIPAQACLEAITVLAQEKGVKAFVMFSAGFKEESQEGAELEKAADWKYPKPCGPHGGRLSR
ncbi:hypothetical protein FACS189428_1030 [Clostridia bacterium]|nr:hypothetical protein FACS189428_1030 [Clostridia bacterium]